MKSVKNIKGDCNMRKSYRTSKAMQATVSGRLPFHDPKTWHFF